jgi:hypothetical protein
MACHAAHNLIADQNSTLSLKLRGSGLNAEIAGELVWLGTTKKDVGISFRNLSAKVQQNIADWIARESQPINNAELGQRAPQKTISEIADFTVREKKTLQRSLSAALALSRAISTNDDSRALEGVNKSDPSILVNSPGGTSPSPPTMETFPAIVHSSSAAEQLEGQVEDRVGDQIEDQGQAGEIHSDIPVEFPEMKHLLDNDQISGLPLVNHMGQFLAEVKQELVPSHKPGEIAQDMALQLPTETAIQGRINEIRPAEPVASLPVSRAIPSSHHTMLVQKWIPPALLSVWNGLNAQQKKLLAHIGAVCIGGMIGLILILAVTHIPGFSSRASGNESSQQAPIPPTSASETSGDFHDAQNPGPTVPSMISSPAHPQSQQTQTSVLSKIVNSIFGNESDESPQINDYQMGLEVWTSQSSGYYYCSDDPYARSVRDGIPKLQGDALQSGYRPRLGQFCN